MSAYWTTLSHNGVNFPDNYVPDGLSIRVKGRAVPLTPLAEEMAYHLAKKKDTPYIQDAVFRSNFMSDFVRQLPDWCRGTTFDEVDFSELFAKSDDEKADREKMTKEQKKAKAAERKVRREALKAKFGVALLDGKQVEIANWMVEPPGLFMGRGCVASPTIVMTTNGPKYAAELVQGDLVATHHGSSKMFYKPIASVAQQGLRETYSLRTRTHQIMATANHPFLTLRVNENRVRNGVGKSNSGRFPATLSWVNLVNLRKGDYVVTTKRYQTPGTSKFSKVARRTFGNMIITPKLARLLGYYLGDGFLLKREGGSESGIAFSEGHTDLVTRYSNLCREVFGLEPVVNKHSGGDSVVLAVFSTEFAGLFASMGFGRDVLTKRVPAWVFGVADDLKFAFIRGYLDADGHRGRHRVNGVEYGSFEFESSNRRLIEDLRELAVSSGLQVSNLSSRTHGYANSLAHRFAISEYSSVTRLLDSEESLEGERTRSYSLNARSNELRRSWDWSRLGILDSQIFGLEKVLEISHCGKHVTYDVSLKDVRDPNFVANGFVVHNSHPLRGRWKPRVTQRDVVLNLGEGVPVPPGEWKEVVHDHNSMWMAKWIDKLTGKEKYVWLHESSPLQQSRSKAKYDNAMRVGQNLQKIRSRILSGLDSKDPRVRQVATVCYLIDTLGMRVGDEKDEDEADTVGASTLRVEHVKIGDRDVRFSFLGKDSVQWNKSDAPPPAVIRNLQEFTKGKSPETEIFHHVSSGMVNEFLSSMVPGVTAKVFRTHHATAKTEEVLRSEDITGADDLDKLYVAKEANLQAAIFCNHQRTPPKTWEQSLQKKELKLAEARARSKPDAERIRKLTAELEFYKRTKNYNLNTSLKNYIDPRVYKAWSDYVGLDWARIYSKSLQRKFSWVAQSHRKWVPETS